MLILDHHFTVPKRLLLLTLCVVGSVLGSASVATAASGESTMMITVGSEPTESIATQLGVSGVGTSEYNAVALTVKPAGGEKCGANFAADGGERVIREKSWIYTQPSSYSNETNFTFEHAGSYVLCGWLEFEGTVLVSAERTLVVRPPHITLSISAPSSVAQGQTFQVATTAQTETGREVYEYIQPDTTRGCPANAAAAASTAGSTDITWPLAGSPWLVDGGPFTESTNVTIRTRGGYLVCAYAQYRTREGVPEAYASSTVSVGYVHRAPQPPPVANCLVPTLTGETLAQAKASLSHAHCRLGRVRKLTRQKGRPVVISEHPGARRKLRSGAKVSVSVG